MNNNETKAFIEEGGFLKDINDFAARQFGFECDFHFDPDNKLPELVDCSHNAQEELTGTPFLRHIFRLALLTGTVYHFPNDNEIQVRFRVEYNHPGGGWNGRTLGRLAINTVTRDTDWAGPEIVG